MDAKKFIPMKGYSCGPYGFTCWLPRLGMNDDEPQWTATVNGAELSARYPTLEDAMRAALAHR